MTSKKFKELEKSYKAKVCEGWEEYLYPTFMQGRNEGETSMIFQLCIIKELLLDISQRLDKGLKVQETKGLLE